MTVDNPDAVRSNLIKQINYLFRNPSLTSSQREQVNRDLSEIVNKLKSFETAEQPIAKK